MTWLVKPFPYKFEDLSLEFLLSHKTGHVLLKSLHSYSEVGGSDRESLKVYDN